MQFTAQEGRKKESFVMIKVFLIIIVREYARGSHFVHYQQNLSEMTIHNKLSLEA